MNFLILVIIVHSTSIPQGMRVQSSQDGKVPYTKPSAEFNKLCKDHSEPKRSNIDQMKLRLQDPRPPW